MNEDTTSTISIVTSDPDNDPVTASVKSDTSALKVSLASNVITLTPGHKLVWKCEHNNNGK